MRILISIIVFLLLMNKVVFSENYGDTLYSLSNTLSKAKQKDKPIFMIIYDSKSPTKSNLNHRYSHFMNLDATKKLIKDNFMVVIAKCNNKDIVLRKEELGYNPDDFPLDCFLVVMAPDGKILARDILFGTQDAGLSATVKYIKIWKDYKILRDATNVVNDASSN